MPDVRLAIRLPTRSPHPYHRPIFSTLVSPTPYPLLCRVCRQEELKHWAVDLGLVAKPSGEFGQLAASGRYLVTEDLTALEEIKKQREYAAEDAALGQVCGAFRWGLASVSCAHVCVCACMRVVRTGGFLCLCLCAPHPGVPLFEGPPVCCYSLGGAWSECLVCVLGGGGGRVLVLRAHVLVLLLHGARPVSTLSLSPPPCSRRRCCSAH